MKLELIIRDSEGLETPASTETLAPSKEYTVGESCILRLREDGPSRDYTLELITQRPQSPSPEGNGSGSPLSQALAIITLVPQTVFETFDGSALRLLGILAHAKGMEMHSATLALQSSGLLSTLSADDVDNALSKAESRLSDQGFQDLLRHPSETTWVLLVADPEARQGATPD